MAEPVMNDAAVAEVERREAEWMDPGAGMASAPGVRPDSVNLTIDYVEPAAVPAATAVQLTVYGKGVPYDGQGFAPGCAVYVNGVACPTTTVGLTENVVHASVGAGVCPSVGTVDVYVRNPSGIQSEPVQLTVGGSGPTPTSELNYTLEPWDTPPDQRGLIRMASGDQSDPVTIWLSTVDADGYDQTATLVGAPVPGVLRMEGATDAAAFQEYVYEAAPVIDPAGYATVASPIHWNVGGPLDSPVDVLVTLRPYP